MDAKNSLALLLFLGVLLTGIAGIIYLQRREMTRSDAEEDPPDNFLNFLEFFGRYMAREEHREKTVGEKFDMLMKEYCSAYRTMMDAMHGEAEKLPEFYADNILHYIKSKNKKNEDKERLLGSVDPKEKQKMVSRLLSTWKLIFNERMKVVNPSSFTTEMLKDASDVVESNAKLADSVRDILFGNRSDLPERMVWGVHKRFEWNERICNYTRCAINRLATEAEIQRQSSGMFPSMDNASNKTPGPETDGKESSEAEGDAGGSKMPSAGEQQLESNKTSDSKTEDIEPLTPEISPDAAAETVGMPKFTVRGCVGEPVGGPPQEDVTKGGERPPAFLTKTLLSAAHAGLNLVWKLILWTHRNFGTRGLLLSPVIPGIM
jgi:hypothetical protein